LAKWRQDKVESQISAIGRWDIGAKIEWSVPTRQPWRAAADLIARSRFTGRIGNLAPIGTT
jgi:hypothetical protein